jgi:hypothetical protein
VRDILLMREVALLRFAPERATGLPRHPGPSIVGVIKTTTDCGKILCIGAAHGISG